MIHPKDYFQNHQIRKIKIEKLDIKLKHYPQELTEENIANEMN